MKDLLFEIQEFWQILIKSLRAAVILKIEAIKLRLAIWLSDLRQKAANKRFFVVLVTVGYRRSPLTPTGGTGQEIVRLRSICNDEFKELKRRGLLPKNMSYLELSEKCFYQTDLKRNNTQNAEEREKAKERYLRFQRGLRNFV